MIETFDTPPRRSKPPTSEELAEIRAHAMKSIARGVPEPWTVATSLPEPSRTALSRAYTAQDPDNLGARRCHVENIHLLFPWGLCDARGYLGAFGMAVRAEIMAVRP